MRKDIKKTITALLTTRCGCGQAIRIPMELNKEGVTIKMPLRSTSNPKYECVFSIDGRELPKPAPPSRTFKWDYSEHFSEVEEEEE